jgi:hypothetical protein
MNRGLPLELARLTAYLHRVPSPEPGRLVAGMLDFATRIQADSLSSRRY